MRERPRVVMVQVLGLIVLVAVGVVIGMAVKADPAPKTPTAVQQRLDDLERSQQTSAAKLKRAQRTNVRQARTIRALRRLERADAARIARFRRALAKARG